MQPYLFRLRLWSSQPKTYIDRQWVDSAATSHPSGAPLGSSQAMLPSLQRPAPGSHDSESVCMCVRVHGLEGGMGVSRGMNQPLSSATHPLTYRARFSRTQKVNSHPFSHFSVSFCHLSLPPPTSLSSEVNKELFQTDMRNSGDVVCVRMYV